MTDTTPGARSLGTTVAAVLGAAFTLAGLAGFFVADDVAGQEGDSLLGFSVNHLHNLVHLGIGLALLAASRRTSTARSANLAIGISYLVLAALGPFITGTELDVIALNGADHVLHLLSGALLTAVGVLADTRSRTRA